MSGRSYCVNQAEHFELAGSAGGPFSRAGWYEFDEPADRWRLVSTAQLTDEEFEHHKQAQLTELGRLEAAMRNVRRELDWMSTEMDRRKAS